MNRNRGPGTFGIIGLVAFYGVFHVASTGRLELNRHGPPRYLTWEADPVVFGALAGTIALLGTVCIWIRWARRK